MLWYSQEYSMVSLSSGPRIKMCSHISSSTFGLPWPVCLPCCSPLSDSNQLLSLSLLLHRDSYVLQQALRKLIFSLAGCLSLLTIVFVSSPLSKCFTLLGCAYPDSGVSMLKEKGVRSNHQRRVTQPADC